MNKILRQLLVMSVCVSIFGSTLYADSTVDEAKIDIILNNLPVDDNIPVWDEARKLAELGDEYKDALTLKLQNASTIEAVAISYALMSMGSQREAALKLEKIIRDKNIPLSRRVDACDILGSEGGGYAKARLRNMLKDKELDNKIRIQIAESLWNLSYSPSALKAIQENCRKF